MAATRRAGRMRGKRILLTQAIRQQNIHQRTLILKQQDRERLVLWALWWALATGGQLRERNTALVGDNRRLRRALGHERPMLAVVVPADLEA